MNGRIQNTEVRSQESELKMMPHLERLLSEADELSGDPEQLRAWNMRAQTCLVFTLAECMSRDLYIRVEANNQ
jgi:hypothetical protein